MRLMYSLLIIIEIVLLGICAVKSINKKGKLAKIVLYYEAVAFIAGVFFWIYTYVRRVLIITIFVKVLHLHVMTGLLYCLCTIPSIIQDFLKVSGL